MTMSLTTMNGVIIGGGGRLLLRRRVVVGGQMKIVSLSKKVLLNYPNYSNCGGVGVGVMKMMMIKGSSSSASFITPSSLVRNSQHASNGVIAAPASLVATRRRRIVVSQNDDIALRSCLDNNTIASTTVYYDDNYKGNIDDAAAELDKHNEQQQFTKTAEKRSNQQQPQPSSTTQNYNNNNADYLVYLLQSIPSPLTTYIGITTNPSRRLRQHNGYLSTGGTRRTKTHRPYKYIVLLHGVGQSKAAAMKFEWHWQHVHKSLVFRNSTANMSDKVAKKMKRTRGVQSRLVELDILLNQCIPFNTIPDITLYFMEEVYHDMYCSIAAASGKDDDDDKDICTTTHNNQPKN
jgi:predicted GIY-YIG superfamily endonuclease